MCTVFIKMNLTAFRIPRHATARLVELNVIEQCLNLFKTGVVQRRRVQTFKEGSEYTTPRIHACVFDPKTGDLTKLPVRQVRCAHILYLYQGLQTHSTWWLAAYLVAAGQFLGLYGRSPWNIRPLQCQGRITIRIYLTNRSPRLHVLRLPSRVSSWSPYDMHPWRRNIRFYFSDRNS